MGLSWQKIIQHRFAYTKGGEISLEPSPFLYFFFFSHNILGNHLLHTCHCPILGMVVAMSWVVFCPNPFWSFKPQCDGIWGWGIWEVWMRSWGWGSHSGLSALRWRETRVCSFSRHVKTQQEVSCLQVRKRASAETEWARTCHCTWERLAGIFRFPGA